MSNDGEEVAPVATPADVRSRINLPDSADESDLEGFDGVSDMDIQTYLEDAAFELSQVTNLDHLDYGLRKQLEWRLAAIEILSIRKGSRSYHQQSLGSMSRSYEAKQIDELKEWCERHGPDGLFDDGGEFWSASIQG